MEYILGIILFILGPIVTLFQAFTSEQPYLIYSCIIWLLSLFVIFSLRNSKNNFICIFLAFLSSFIYAITHCIWYYECVINSDLSSGGLGDLIGTFLIPFTVLVPMWLIGELASNFLKVLAQIIKIYREQKRLQNKKKQQKNICNISETKNITKGMRKKINRNR